MIGSKEQNLYLKKIIHEFRNKKSFSGIHNGNENNGYQNIVEVFNQFFSYNFKVSPSNNIFIDHSLQNPFF